MSKDYDDRAQRLRDTAWYRGDCEVRMEAADAIEKLRKERDATSPSYTRLQKSLKNTANLLEAVTKERDAAIDALKMAREALLPVSELHIGVSMNNDAAAAWTVLGIHDVHKTKLSAGDVRNARKARAAIDAVLKQGDGE